MVKPIDLEHLDQYICGDRALLNEVLAIFMEQAASWAGGMHPAMDDKSWRHAAHTLKGAARGVGAWRLGEAAAHAEELVGPGLETERRAALAKIVEFSTEAIDYARWLRARAA